MSKSNNEFSELQNWLLDNADILNAMHSDPELLKLVRAYIIEHVNGQHQAMQAHHQAGNA